jgi:hypothetical protein
MFFVRRHALECAIRSASGLRIEAVEAEGVVLDRQDRETGITGLAGDRLERRRP